MPSEKRKYVESCTKVLTMWGENKQIFQVQTGFQSQKPKQKFLGKLVKMMYIKYQCHPKSRSMLWVFLLFTKFAHCETRLKFVCIKTSFQSQNPNQNFWNSKIFWKKVLRNIVKIICTKYQFNQKTRSKFV